VAWVLDDYGDGKVSRDFFQAHIPAEQKKAADKTRALIAKELGTYYEHRQAVEHPENSRPDVVQRARKLGSLAIQLQWVTGNATKAEASFFKINQSATLIDKTELRILKSRKQPNALAARVIIHNASGHKYWQKFTAARQRKIEALGKEIYKTLFDPPLKTPIKTLDIPVAGRGYSAQALPLIFELVNLSNDQKIVDPTAKRRIIDSAEDLDGDSTITFLTNTRHVVNRISGLHSSSLGLHPVVYFYSADGRYQPTSFLAVVALMKDLDRTNRFKEFTSVRMAFEDLLIAHKAWPNEITVRWGSGVKGFRRLEELYLLIIDALLKGKSESKIIRLLAKSESFRFLGTEAPHIETRKRFSDEQKSETFLSKAVTSAVRCSGCRGLMHVGSITIDHVDRKRDGGKAAITNAEVSHPFCNSTVKG
jgi:hypothetical protein